MNGEANKDPSYPSSSNLGDYNESQAPYNEDLEALDHQQRYSTTGANTASLQQDQQEQKQEQPEQKQEQDQQEQQEQEQEQPEQQDQQEQQEQKQEQAQKQEQEGKQEQLSSSANETKGYEGYREAEAEAEEDRLLKEAESALFDVDEAVLEALQQSFPSTDPLDSADFDTVAYLNDQFPDESSLALIDGFMDGLGKKVSQLDSEIHDAVVGQAVGAHDAVRNIEDAKVAINEMFTKVQDIKTKADQSDVMVQETCRDIKRLDNAKSNLTATKRSLTRLSMFLTAVEKLESSVNDRQYHETAQLVGAVTELSEYFKGYDESVPKVKELRNTVSSVRDSLTKQIFEDMEYIADISADFVDMSSPHHDDDAASTFDNTNTADSGYDRSYSRSVDTSYLHHHHQHHRERDFYMDNESPETLSGACAVADALGLKIRKQLRKKVCEKLLAPYLKIFRPGAPDATLDTVERRFTWLRRLLRENEKRFQQIFPESWHIEAHIKLSFMKVTADHLEQLLRNAQGTSSLDVSSMMRALRKAIDFEQEFVNQLSIAEKQYFMEYGQSPTSKTLKDDDDDDDDAVDADDHNNGNDEQVNEADKGAEAEAEAGAGAGAENGDEDAAGRAHIGTTQGASSSSSSAKSHGTTQSQNHASEVNSDTDPPPSPSLVRGMFNKVFTPFLDAYVSKLSQTIQEKLEESYNEDRSMDSQPGNVLAGGPECLPSATSLFLNIKNAISSCTQFSTGKPLYNLQLEFQRLMSDYSKYLEQKIPTVDGPSSGANSITVKSGLGKKFDERAIRTTCCVVSSSEYCTDTVSQLESLVQRRIDEVYAERVSMEESQDRFYTIISKGVTALVQGIMSKVEPHLNAIIRENWETFDNPGDRSGFVVGIASVLQENVPRIKQSLSGVYFRNFHNKFAEAFIKRFRETLIRCKRIGEIGAQQLLVDASAIKTVLLGLPEMEPMEPGSGMAPEWQQPVIADHHHQSRDGALSEHQHQQQQQQQQQQQHRQYQGNTKLVGIEPYRKFVNAQMGNCEKLLKMVSMNTQDNLLVENFKLLWPEGTLDDLQDIATLRGLKKKEAQDLLDQARAMGKQNTKESGAPSSVNDNSGATVSSLSAEATGNETEALAWRTEGGISSAKNQNQAGIGGNDSTLRAGRRHADTLEATAGYLTAASGAGQGGAGAGQSSGMDTAVPGAKHDTSKQTLNNLFGKMSDVFGKTTTELERSYKRVTKKS